MPTSPTVLLADDEAICLAITSKMLEQAGVRVITACDGIEALELYEKHMGQIGVVLLDIEMPRLNGVETFRSLKKLCNDVRVVFVSGHVTPANRAKIDALGPVGYVEKPLTMKHLSPFLDSLIP